MELSRGVSAGNNFVLAWACHGVGDANPRTRARKPKAGHHYTVAQEKGRLVLTKKTGDMRLFLNVLDDRHQWVFMRNQQMVKEIERLRVLLTTTNQQRESWKVRALMAEAQLLEATAKTGNKGGGAENVSDVRYASLKRYLAK